MGGCLEASFNKVSNTTFDSTTIDSCTDACPESTTTTTTEPETTSTTDPTTTTDPTSTTVIPNPATSTTTESATTTTTEPKTNSTTDPTTSADPSTTTTSESTTSQSTTTYPPTTTTDPPTNLPLIPTTVPVVPTTIPVIPTTDPLTSATSESTTTATSEPTTTTTRESTTSESTTKYPPTTTIDPPITLPLIQTTVPVVPTTDPVTSGTPEPKTSTIPVPTTTATPESTTGESTTTYPPTTTIDPPTTIPLIPTTVPVVPTTVPLIPTTVPDVPTTAPVVPTTDPATSTTPKSTTTPSPVKQEIVTILVTGFPSKRMEIIKENGETITCPKSSDFPINLNLATGNYLNNDVIVVCGGISNPGAISDCYTFSNFVWQQRNKGLITERYFHASSVTNNNTIWITGGVNLGNEKFSSTELIHTDGTVTSGPDLPEPRREHCQVSYENTTLIIGGFRSSSVLKYDTNNIHGGPIEGESMVSERNRHACTIFNSPIHDQRPVAIAAGSDLRSPSGMKTAEIWDYTQDGARWEEIGNLPIDMDAAKMSPTANGDNVILTYEKSIYSLTRSGMSYQWEEKQQKLSISRDKHLQFSVPLSMISC